MTMALLSFLLSFLLTCEMARLQGLFVGTGGRWSTKCFARDVWAKVLSLPTDVWTKVSGAAYFYMGMGTLCRNIVLLEKSAVSPTLSTFQRRPPLLAWKVEVGRFVSPWRPLPGPLVYEQWMRTGHGIAWSQRMTEPFLIIVLAVVSKTPPALVTQKFPVTLLLKQSLLLPLKAMWTPPLFLGRIDPKTGL